MSTDIILEAKGLVKHFGGQRKGLFGKASIVKAVDAVDLAIRRGETFAIVGESGCGKSTLARLLLGLIAPSAGRVCFNGAEISAARPAELRRLRRDMQMIFQDPFSSLNPRMSVGDLVAEPMRVHNLAAGVELKRRVAETLTLVGLLPEHADRYPHEFSGGQRQRIAIARALASGPSLIVGDEPVSALDVSIRAQVINLLEDLKARLNLTVLLVAHDLAVIRHTADRVAVMYLGEIVELARAKDLFTRPLHPYTQALMAAIPLPSPRARSERALLEGDPPSPVDLPEGCRFHTRCVHARARCSTDHPALAETESGHAVACHFAREIAAIGTTGIQLPVESALKTRRIALLAAAQQRALPVLPSPAPSPAAKE